MEKTSEEKGILQLKAIVIGPTGAVGRELTDFLLNSEHFSKVTVLARRKIERWNSLSEEKAKKFNFIQVENLEILNKESQFLKDELFSGESDYDSLFCCLGSRTGKGKEEFIKVDYDYVVYSAILCEKFLIPHFSVVSSGGADPKSWFLYMKTKGRADEECLRRNITSKNIFRPGLIMDRDNDDRTGEKILSWVPFIPKITSTDLARAIYNNSVLYHRDYKGKQQALVITHKEILNLVNVRI
jgi:oxidoreductase